MLLLLILLSGVSTPSSNAPRSVKSFAVYALSRGSGVPPTAREALRKVQALVEKDQKRGIGVTIETTRIGIEGETRDRRSRSLCSLRHAAARAHVRLPP